MPGTERARGPTRTALTGAALFVVLLGVFGLTFGHHPSIDVTMDHLGGWRVATTGSSAVTYDEISSVTDEYDESFVETGFWLTPGADGAQVVARANGAIVASIPAYWVAGLGGDQSFSQTPGGWTAALLTAAACLLLFLSLLRLVGDRFALSATTAFALTTPVWSVAADGVWTHTVTLVGLAGLAWGVSRERWLLAGLLGGVGIWGRLHVALVVAIVGLGLAYARRSPRIALLLAVSSGLMMALSSLWSHWVYGHWNPAGPYGTDIASRTEGVLDITDESPLLSLARNQLGMWVSLDRGILVWTPLLLLGLVPLAKEWRGLPDWTRWLAGAGAAYVLVQAQLNDYDGGDAFYGYRLTLELLVTATPAVAVAWSRRPTLVPPQLAGAVLGGQFAVISLGAIFDGARPDTDFWTNEAFLLVRASPVLLVWVLLCAGVGAMAVDLTRRRSVEAAATPAPSPAVGGD